MRNIPLHRLLTSVVLASGLLLSATGHAHDKAQAGRVPMPVHTIAQGEKCVEPTPEMRRNHMEKILHQRDRTMHDGIRTKQYSLKNCVNCHADTKTNSVLGKDGFCESCHRYASVSIDCFSCHTSERETQAAAPATTSSTARALNSGAKGNTKP
jgi:hypothetical protein